MSAIVSFAETSSSSELLLSVIKGSAILILTGVCIGFGIAPLKSTKFQNNPWLIGYVNSFSAGLFLAMGLLHLLCESLKDYNDYAKIENGSKDPYPVPVLVVILSFSFILFLEKIIFSEHELIHSDDENNEDQQGNKEDDPHQQITKPMLLDKRTSAGCDPLSEEEAFKRIVGLKGKLAKSHFQKQRPLKITKALSLGSHLKNTVLSLPETYTLDVSEKNAILALDLTDIKHQNEEKQEHDHHHEHEHQHRMGPYPILIALSIHGGVAVGIQDTVGSSLNLVIAVLLHKWAEALTLGVGLYKANVPQKAITIQIIIFSIAGPLGIIIGWILSDASMLVSSILNAIPAGTFLYVAATELIVEEFSISKNTSKKFVCYLAGIAAMSLILLMG